MPRPTIEYLNARRDSKVASGGKCYVVKRNTADDRSQWRAMDVAERIQEEIAETLSDLNRAVQALRAHAATFETLTPGECFEDLVF